MKHLKRQNSRETLFSDRMIFILLYCVLTTVTTVSAQCSSGFELTCEWLQNQKSVLKWTSKTDPAGYNVVELKECEHPDCGVGIITTPWLEPRGQTDRISFNYKIYGTTEVYLRLYLIDGAGGSGQHQLLSITGNYAYGFPETWTVKDIFLPAVSSKHRFMIKAHIPYKEAYIAVKDIVLSNDILATSTAATFASPEREAEIIFSSTESRMNEIDLSTPTTGQNLYYWNGALSSIEAFPFLTITYLPILLQHYLKVFCLILTTVYTMKLNKRN